MTAGNKASRGLCLQTAPPHDIMHSIFGVQM
nr:MAG TPA: hypothetical protein [Caudoviricetes sp.]